MEGVADAVARVPGARPVIDDPLEPRAGLLIGGRFVLERAIGRGGMARVWQARDHDGGSVAVKILNAPLRASGRIVERFSREMEVLARLEHPNIARLVAASESGWFAMEVAEGRPLHQILIDRALSHRPLAIEEVLGVFVEIGRAIGFAHQLGVIHRDLKPSNVMVAGPLERPKVKVLDFGVAQLIDLDEAMKTTLGVAVGTASYMSPEMVMGRASDKRSDVFALGTILFELLCLRRAWVLDAQGQHLSPAEPGTHRGEILARIATGPRPLASKLRPGLPPETDALFARLLAVDPDARPADAEALLDEVAAVLAPAAVATVVAALPDDGPGDQTRTDQARAPLVALERAGAPLPWGALGLLGAGTIALSAWLAFAPRPAPKTITAEPTARPAAPVVPAVLPSAAIAPTASATATLAHRPNPPAKDLGKKPSHARAPVPPPKPDPPPKQNLERLLEEAREDPADLRRIDRLQQALLSAAALLRDPAERQAIETLATSSGMVGDLEGLALCVKRLRRVEP
jgi:serine/threonine-protein kinase